MIPSSGLKSKIREEFPSGVKIISVLRDFAPCRLVNSYQCLGKTYCHSFRVPENTVFGLSFLGTLDPEDIRSFETSVPIQLGTT